MHRTKEQRDRREDGLSERMCSLGRKNKNKKLKESVRKPCQEMVSGVKTKGEGACALS